MEKLSKRALGCMYTAAIIWAVIGIAGIIVANVMWLIPEGIQIGTTISIVVAILILANAIISPYFRYHRYRYSITDEFIDIYEGYIFVERNIVPLERLHKMQMLKGPIDRMFKVAKVVVTTAGAGHKKVGKYLDETLENMGYNQRYNLFLIHSHDAHGYLPLETKQKIDKEVIKFYSSIKENKLTSPSFKALIMYNVWRAMAGNNTIGYDNKYWIENKLINHEYSPEVPCNRVKKLPMKIFYKIMLMFLSKNTVKKE